MMYTTDEETMRRVETDQEKLDKVAIRGALPSRCHVAFRLGDDEEQVVWDGRELDNPNMVADAVIATLSKIEQIKFFAVRVSRVYHLERMSDQERADADDRARGARAVQERRSVGW